MLRKYEPTGPLVNAEFYPGWFTHWHDPVILLIHLFFKFKFIRLFNNNDFKFDKAPGSADTQKVAESLR